MRSSRPFVGVGVGVVLTLVQADLASAQSTTSQPVAHSSALDQPLAIAKPVAEPSVESSAKPSGTGAIDTPNEVLREEISSREPSLQALVDASQQVAQPTLDVLAPREPSLRALVEASRQVAQPGVGVLSQSAVSVVKPARKPIPPLSLPPTRSRLLADVQKLFTDSQDVAMAGLRPTPPRIVSLKPISSAQMASTAASSAMPPSAAGSAVGKPVSPLSAQQLTESANPALLLGQASPFPDPTQMPSAPDSSSPFTSPTTVPSTIAPNLTTPTGQAQPIGPAKAGAAPDYLNPDPNPLSFPTKPEEVQLQGIQPITLQQALDLARRNNRSINSLDSFQTLNIRTAELAVEDARAALRAAKAALFPTFGLTGGITQQQSASGQIQEEGAQLSQQNLPRRFRQGTDVDGSSTTFNSAIQLVYDVYTGGRRPAQIRAAERQLRTTELTLERQYTTLRDTVRSAYYDLQAADENVRIRQSAVRNAEASLRDTQALERAGLGTRFDVLRAQVQLANSRQDLVNAIAQQRNNRQALGQLLAVPPTIDLAAADPVELAGQWPLSADQSIILALKNSTQIEQLLVQREIADQQKAIELSALKPSVNLTVQYNVLDNLRDQIGFGDGYSATLGFQWNILDGGAARARAKRQEIAKQTAEQQLAGIRDRVVLDTRTSYNNLASSFTNITTARQALEQAREALRLARLRFQAGVGTQTDVINAENDLTSSEGNVVTAILGYNRALSALERIVNTAPIPTGATQPTVPSPVNSGN
jgi:outer membrane protein TolC